MRIILYLLFASFFSFSCSTKKQILRLQDLHPSTKDLQLFETPKIQAQDILHISVSALIPESTIAYNNNTNLDTNKISFDMMKLEGYVVTNELTISFPQLGTIYLKGMTTTDLEAHIITRLNKEAHLKNAQVKVRNLNTKFTVLGEVNNPGTFPYREQKITFLQAIGLAGDLTIHADRKSIKVIREFDDQRKIGSVDFTKSDWMNSPWYYLKPGDVILISPNNSKARSAGFIKDLGSTVSIIASVISTIFLINNL